jgi:CheY-like chemotaxis protein
MSVAPEGNRNMADDKTILVVDDDQLLREGLTAVLGKHGYRTLEADDGRAARHLIDEHRPDLVILDMMMPRWGGLAVLEHYQGMSGAPRFIMITANEGKSHKDYAEQLGVVDYIRKPFSLERLVEGVKKAVCPPAAAPQSGADGEAVTALRCRCPGCGSRIKAPLQLTGQTRNCPNCKCPFVVVFLPPDSEGPMLVPDDAPVSAQPTRRQQS